MIFVDASAAIAILAGEEEAADLLAAVDAEDTLVTSPVALYETALGLARLRAFSIAEAKAIVAEFVSAAGIEIMPVGAAEYDAALEAFSQFGKGRHPAQFNMGDCFAYACAKARGLRLLYKGGDFALTDLA